MNDSQTPSPTQDPDLQELVAALQRQVFSLLLALIVVSATVVFYLYYQSRIMSHDLTDIPPQAMQVIRAYNQNAQGIAKFGKQLSNYALTHPEFQPVLKKYGWTPATATK